MPCREKLQHVIARRLFPVIARRLFLVIARRLFPVIARRLFLVIARRYAEAIYPLGKARNKVVDCFNVMRFAMTEWVYTLYRILFGFF